MVFVIVCLVCWLGGYTMYMKAKTRWDTARVREIVGDGRLPDKVEWNDGGESPDRDSWNQKVDRVREME
jgi:hypothetical protein